MIIPEYRGYSILKSYPPEIEAIKSDIEYFITELSNRQHLNISKTILFVAYSYIQGRSLGSHIASYLSSKLDIHSCVIFSGFPSIAKVVEYKMSYYAGCLIKQACDNFEYLSRSTCRILMIHGYEVRYMICRMT